MIKSPVEKVQILLALPLLAYSMIMAERIFSGGTGRLGGDTIELAYGLAAASFLAGIIAFVAHQRIRISKFGVAVHWVTAVAIIAWFTLHLSGLVYSHASMLEANGKMPL